jgi:hypothetical protein
MKFKARTPRQIPESATATHSWFALWPVTINGETRWLECVTVEFSYFAGHLTAMPGWFPKSFVNEA